VAPPDAELVLSVLESANARAGDNMVTAPANTISSKKRAALPLTLHGIFAPQRITNWCDGRLEHLAESIYGVNSNTTPQLQELSPPW
jgi:hypothetical protein